MGKATGFMEFTRETPTRRPVPERVRDWLERHVPRGTGSAVELGCVPGNYLAVLGELGYEGWVGFLERLSVQAFTGL